MRYLIHGGGDGDESWSTVGRAGCIRDNLSAAGIPIMYFEDKTTGHGGDLFEPRGGDFTKINLAWLNWWLKGDQGATGKGLLVGGGCPYCTDNNWVVMSANLP